MIDGIETGSEFGVSTAISSDGSILVVGAKNALNKNRQMTGAVYIYLLDAFISGTSLVGTDSADSLEPFQVIEGQSPGGEFGGALALSSDGKHLVVGSRAEDSERGAMRMYEITDSAVLLRRIL